MSILLILSKNSANFAALREISHHAFTTLGLRGSVTLCKTAVKRGGFGSLTPCLDSVLALNAAFLRLAQDVSSAERGISLA